MAGASVIFAYRRVLLLRSDIPIGVIFGYAECKGEYNTTFRKENNTPSICSA